MKYSDMFNVVKELTFDKQLPVCNDDDGVQLSIFRPSKLGKRFQNYDPKKNFQIWLKEGEREFRPNHLRVFIDLNLRSRSRQDLKRPLLTIFDNIFYGNDPDKEITLINSETFEHYLNSLKIIANLAQLLIIEQNYGYHGESNFDPPTLFFQGWVRQFIDSPKEIDNLCMSVCNRQPPQARYTAKENRKGNKFEKSLSPLWYMNNE